MTLALGVSHTAGGTQFAVTARDAERVELCLFDGKRETRLAMQRREGVHVVLADVLPGQRYGYRAHGPWAPEQGLMFDSTKLLVDPYATQLDGRFQYDARLSLRGVDTAALVPKAIVASPMEVVAPPPPVFTPGGLIYELNVRGFTQRHPEIPPQLRGTIRALAHPAIIAHFKKLGVNAIELMPIVAWIDERHLPPLGLRNAWGYNPVVPMAIDPGLAPGGVEELEDTVVDLRRAGIGVILDLVLNHTGESDLDGPTLSLRGLDNRCYARRADGTLINDAGTGNILDASDAVVRTMMLDTLRHFARLGVDGFRFDLATILARSPAFDPHAPIFAEIANDPLLRDRITIAEPWDVGPGGYQLGQFPDCWLEWNDRYRDDVRRFWRGDGGVGSLATRLTGSSDIFSGKRSRSVNFVASHDGMTLADTVCYAVKHNQANGEDNRDGQEENFSWNNGAEGGSPDPEIRQRRQADMRALLATLFATRGTIQLTAGDEFGRSQGGNNNAYAQDNEITWVDWEGRDTELEDFAAACAKTRAANPVLSDTGFLASADWYDLDGTPMTAEKWENPQTTGFEVHIPMTGAEILSIRIDRDARQCLVRRKIPR
ncbi:MAG TPA: glycogen debranching protein GlgX [Rhizomicrobium sp.]|nr:glycogen debranching protein GlgX [Rhizomicrobium sp.]